MLVLFAWSHGVSKCYDLTTETESMLHYESVPQPHSCIQKTLLLQPFLVILWQPQAPLTNHKQTHHKSSSPLPSSTPGISFADSFASFFTYKISYLLSLSSNPTTSSPHSPSSHTTPPDFFSFTPSESEISRFCLTVLTSNLILILSPLGFSRNVHLFLSPQSLISSAPLSPLGSFTPFAKNLSFLHCLRSLP